MSRIGHGPVRDNNYPKKSSTATKTVSVRDNNSLKKSRWRPTHRVKEESSKTKKATNRKRKKWTVGERKVKGRSKERTEKESEREQEYE